MGILSVDGILLMPVNTVTVSTKDSGDQSHVSLYRRVKSAECADFQMEFAGLF